MPRLRIEEKHTYNTEDDYIVGNNRIADITTPIQNFAWTTPYYPVTGTDENNRIGRKIQSLSIGVEGYLNLETHQASESGTYILDYFNGWMQEFIDSTPPETYSFNIDWQKLLIPIRHMVVEFEDEEFYNGTDGEKSMYLTNWYKNLVTQSMQQSSYYPSVQQSTLRESTPYTGRFKILKDTMYWLDFKDKHMIHFNYQLPYKKTITFDADGADPTNTHLYFLFIGPTQPLLDYANLGFGTFINNPNNQLTASPRVAQVHTNLKLKFIDV
jgi:hypothetical protein